VAYPQMNLKVEAMTFKISATELSHLADIGVCGAQKIVDGRSTIITYTELSEDRFVLDNDFNILEWTRTDEKGQLSTLHATRRMLTEMAKTHPL
jgi:hypothetical protein